jgi:hypothetical protein
MYVCMYVALVWDYLLGPHSHMAISVGHMLPAKQCHVDISILAVAQPEHYLLLHCVF